MTPIEELLRNISMRKLPEGMTSVKPGVLYFRPNNYRRGIRVDSTTLKVWKRSVGKVGPRGLVFVKYRGILLQLGRDTVVGIWSQGDRRVWEIARGSYVECAGRLGEIKDEVRCFIDGAVLDFLGVNSIPPVGVVGDVKGGFWWVRSEDWIRGEEYIDRLPRDLIIHDQVFKKVYAEGIEAQGGKNVEPVERVRRYLRNRMLEDFAPQIALELERLERPPLWRAQDYLENNGFTQENLIAAGELCSRSERPALYSYFLEHFEELAYER